MITDAAPNSAAHSATRNVIVRAIHSETGARDRALVENNRRQVHEATNFAVGYVHIPDMNASGYAALPVLERDGLIIDVRYNGGGQVSQLILGEAGAGGSAIIYRVGADFPPYSLTHRWQDRWWR